MAHALVHRLTAKVIGRLRSRRNVWVRTATDPKASVSVKLSSKTPTSTNTKLADIVSATSGKFTDRVEARKATKR